ncbi:MAG: hypothetical protein AAGH72_11125 [Verrucomicrobiota bacterium]
MITVLQLWAVAGLALAQAPDFLGPGNPQTPAPDSSQGNSMQPTVIQSSSRESNNQGLGLGQDIPFMDMGSGTVSWDGKLWNIDNNRLFRSQFERYLNNAAETSDAENEYRQLIEQMMTMLTKSRVSSSQLEDAVSLLPQASSYDVDANLCDALANTIYNVWQAKNEQARLERTNSKLRRQIETQQWNARASANSGLNNPPRNAEAAKIWQEERQLRRDLTMGPYIKRAAELEAMVLGNKTKKEISELQAKINFQMLISQFFFQRRFEHVVLASRFYQAVFGDGDTKLQTGGEMEKVFAETSGNPPTLGVLESLSNQAISDVEEGVEAFHYLLEKRELASATERLQEAFAIGQYLPVIRSLPRDDKREVLDFQQKRNQLLSALEVRDYTLAKELVEKLETMAEDFDASKAHAVIQTASTVSSMHLVKARAAATSGDKETLENELKAAAEIWPRNPDLAEFTKEIFTQTDVQQQAIAELDRLIQTKNYREIFNNQVRYIAAAALYPEKQDILKEVLEEMQLLEGTLMRAKELSSRGDHAGGWECLELVIDRFSYDSQINQLRAELTTKASEFVRQLREAQELEEKGQLGSSLAWYLNAQKEYPMSILAKEGVDRVVAEIIPSGSSLGSVDVFEISLTRTL